jgi:hypothetical protein
MSPETEKHMDRTIISLIGLMVGALLGVLIFGNDAHGMDLNKLTTPDVDSRQVFWVASVGTILDEYDYALNRRGPEQGIHYKQLLAMYLTGLVHGYFIASAHMPSPLYCMGEGSRTLSGGEIVRLLHDEVRRNPAAHDWPFQATILAVLQRIYPCPARATDK